MGAGTEAGLAFQLCSLVPTPMKLLSIPEAEPLSSWDLPLTHLTSSRVKNVTLLHICLPCGWLGKGTVGAGLRLTSLLSYMVI